jgi:20S proteasome alpha/beta subunit
MECSFALTGKGYVIVAADTTAARSIVKMKVDEDKIKTLSPHLLMAYSGEPGMHAILSNVPSPHLWLRRYTPVC